MYPYREHLYYGERWQSTPTGYVASLSLVLQTYAARAHTSVARLLVCAICYRLRFGVVTRVLV